MGSQLSLIDQLGAAVEEAYQDLDLGTQTGVMFMRVSQDDGSVSYGPDNVQVAPSDTLAVSVASLSHGWLVRDGSQVVDEYLSPFTEAKPPQPKVSGRQVAKPAYAIGLVGTPGGPHESVKIAFSGDNGSVRTVFGNVVSFLRRRLAEDHGGAINPVITLVTSKYHNKRYQKDMVTTSAKLEGFVNDEGVATDGTPRVEDQSSAAPRGGRISV